MQRISILLCLLLSCNFVQASTGIEDHIADAASWFILLVLPLQDLSFLESSYLSGKSS
jgi:hypothetical protein